ncbi:cell wall protein [Streptomyces sp. NPDC052015]|uniref:cell wall protein n=1 Tax=Streptomyces sp. NPDC052015 TaxID=3154755 RepID=UPI00342CFC41
MKWLIAAGLHHRANATTLKVAEDLAQRMDYSTGHVLYGLKGMVERLGIPRSTLAKHVAYLRELGALAWVRHGSRANRLRPMGLKGYSATATVYAAVIPPVYDHALGQRIIGTGYEARIVIDHRDRSQIPAQASGPVDNPAVDNSSSEARETHSLTWLRKKGKVEVEGGSNYTSQARQAKSRIPHQSSSSDGRRRRTAADVEKASKVVRLVRALVNWTQSVPLRRLEYVLRPWTDRGWDAFRIADELNGMCAGVRWKPARPDAFIRARIAADTQRQDELAQAVAWEHSTAARDLASLAALFGPATTEPEQERTDEDRERARADWNVWPEVLDHLAEDQDDAIDLYGVPLCQFAISQAARHTTPAY